MNKLLLSLVASAVVAAVLSAVAIAAPSYQVRSVGSLGGIHVIPWGMNNLGDVVGYSQLGGPCGDGANVCGPEHSFAYINGQILDIAAGKTATGINDSQTVVGFDDSQSVTTAYRYANGVLTPLFPAGIPGEALAINNAGAILALYIGVDGRHNVVIGPGGRMTEIPPPTGYTDLFPIQITDTGVVLGVVTGLVGSEYFVWDGTTSHILDDIVGVGHIIGAKMNDAGDIVGMVGSGQLTNPFRPFLFDGSVHDLGALWPGGLISGGAGDVNNSGEIVGFGTTAAGQTLHFLVRGGQMYDLDSLIPWAPAWEALGAPAFINDFGDVVGQGLLRHTPQDSQLHAKDYPYVASPSPLIGSRATWTQTDQDPAGTAEAFRMPASASGSVTTLRVYLDSSSPASTVVVGIYAGDGRPTTLLARGTINHPAAGHWNGVSFSSDIPVTNGTPYWVAILAPQGTGKVRFRDSCCALTGKGKQTETSAQANLRDLPATWTSGTKYKDGPLSAIADTG